MSGEVSKRGPGLWLLSALAAALLAGGACHELDLARLRCSTGGRCPDGYSCRADGFCYQNADGGLATAQRGPPGSKRQGEACQRADDCATLSCVDGVCCNTSCLDACHACNLPNNVGTCVAVAHGKEPVHGDCPKQEAATCGTNGLCDGAGECQRYDDKTMCRKAACDPAANALTPQARCDGHGSCVAADAPLACAPFVCKPDGSGCADSCGDASTCVAPASCTAGSCGKIGNGLPCHNADQCQSGFCVDGVCCNTPCGEQCMACDVTGSLGTCAQVPAGSPHGGRTPCAVTDAACAGQCTPASPTSCTYPGAETVCRSAGCTSNGNSATATTAASCDGRGACGTGSTASCGTFVCGPSGTCATTCAGDFDCIAGYICDGGQCRAKGMSAAPCSSSAQCAAGLTCKDGVCCESACDQPCHACNLPGQGGHCVVVASADDADSCPADTRTCDAAGACKLKGQQACGSSADCAGAGCVTFYPDADGDGYGDRSATTANGQAKGFCGTAPAGAWVTNNGDCCDAGDTLKQVHPGQTGWFTVPGPCGIQFDYDCDGATTMQFAAGGACSDTACATGFTTAVACGASGDYQTCDAAAVACTPPVAQVQSCR